MGLRPELAVAVEEELSANGRRLSDYERRVLRCPNCWVAPPTQASAGRVPVTLCPDHAREFGDVYGRVPACDNCGERGEGLTTRMGV